MRYYPKYLVKDSDKFDSYNYPKIVEDIIVINEATMNVPKTLKADILISFTKNHSLKNEWITANPEFAKLVTTGILPVNNIAFLFEASSKNSFFQQQFEDFLKKSMNGETA